jgi:hypothetical protein
VVFVVSALSEPEVREVFDELDSLDPFDLFEADLAFVAQP